MWEWGVCLRSSTFSHRFFKAPSSTEVWTSSAAARPSVASEALGLTHELLWPPPPTLPHGFWCQRPFPGPHEALQWWSGAGRGEPRWHTSIWLLKGMVPSKAVNHKQKQGRKTQYLFVYCCEKPRAVWQQWLTACIICWLLLEENARLYLQQFLSVPARRWCNMPTYVSCPVFVTKILE